VKENMMNVANYKSIEIIEGSIPRLDISRINK